MGEAAFVTGSAAGVVRPYETPEHPLVGRSHERYLERTRDPSHRKEVFSRARGAGGP